MDSSGSAFSGAAAVNRILTELGRPWAAIAEMYRVPAMQWLEQQAYRWVADHRSRFRFWSSIPECDMPGVTCK